MCEGLSAWWVHNSTIRHLTVVLITLFLLPEYAVDAKPRKTRPRRELLPPETGPTDELIFDSGLLEKSVSSATLYEKSQQFYVDVGIKRFSGPVLGYVTPWNQKGYERAVIFRAKLTHVSPVWYQLKRTQNQEWVLEGGHEYNQTWVAAVQGDKHQGTPRCRVVPRVIVELNHPQDHVTLVTSAATEVVDLLVKEVTNKAYDGLVLEVWMTWFYINAMSNDDFATQALAFVKQLYTRLEAQDCQLLLAVPPVVPQDYGRAYADMKHLRTFSPYVHYWSLMTYDYAMGAGAQPNSPLHWLHKQVQVLQDASGTGPAMARTEQALMGVNFYGYDFALGEQGRREAITGDTFIQLMKKQPVLEWHEADGEHSFTYKASTGPHHVYYPTPRALELRLEMFAKLGLGVSIWELGQGVERFFDLL